MATEQDPEVALASTVALASVFSNCVEAFGLIYPTHKWEREEQVLLSRLGIQQARLLIWGDILGICSPPAWVTTHAVPLHPSATYPDVNEPMYFGARDGRLDDYEIRQKIEKALDGIAERSVHMSAQAMAERYGLKTPKKGVPDFQPALDNNRLERFREVYSLLLDVAEERAHLARRSGSVAQQRWAIGDTRKFTGFIEMIRERVDGLVELMGVGERIDRAMKMDIRAMGWHPNPERSKTAMVISKLRLILDACKEDYPQYVGAVQSALDYLNDEWSGETNYDQVVVQPVKKPQVMTQPVVNSQPEKKKRPGFSLFRPKSWMKPAKEKGRSQSIAGIPEETPRSKSESYAPGSDTDFEALEPVRSKSVSAISAMPASLEEQLESENRLRHIDTVSTMTPEDLTQTETVATMVSRHDQYRGPYRVATKEHRRPH